MISCKMGKSFCIIHKEQSDHIPQPINAFGLYSNEYLLPKFPYTLFKMSFKASDKSLSTCLMAIRFSKMFYIFLLQVPQEL